MRVNDIAIILAKRKVKENLGMITVLTKSHGIYSGIVQNIHTKKNLAASQIASVVDFHWQARVAEHVGTSRIELQRSFAVNIMFNSKNLLYLQSLLALTLQTFKERDPQNNLFVYWLETLQLLNQNKFRILDYINFELLILKIAGYGLSLEKCVVTNSTDNLKYVSPKSGNAVSEHIGYQYENRLLSLPEFLTTKSAPKTPQEIQQAFNLTGYFIQKHISQYPLQIREILLSNCITEMQ